MSVVVTGGNGFIGLHTITKLLEMGYDIKLIDINMNNVQKSPIWESANLRTFKSDITNRQEMENIIEKGDKILHLAAIAHYINQDKILQAIHVNVYGTANIVLAAIKKDAERIVYSSTGSIYSKSVQSPIREDAEVGPSFDNYYGWSKLQAENWIKMFGNQLPYVILRYAYIYGVNKDWGAIGKWIYHDIPETKAPSIFGGKQTNDFTYVKDTIQSNELALETTNINQIYNIGTGRATSILNVCDLCINAMNVDIEPQIVPARTFDYPIFFYDITKARELLHYEPKWNLMKGIKDMVKNLED